MTIQSAQTVVSTFAVEALHTVTATCSTGVVVAGGARLVFSQSNDVSRAFAAQSYPSSSTSWTVVAAITAGGWGNGGPTLTVQSYAICGG